MIKRILSILLITLVLGGTYIVTDTKPVYAANSWLFKMFHDLNNDGVKQSNEPWLFNKTHYRFKMNIFCPNPLTEYNQVKSPDSTGAFSVTQHCVSNPQGTGTWSVYLDYNQVPGSNASTCRQYSGNFPTNDYSLIKLIACPFPA